MGTFNFIQYSILVRNCVQNMFYVSNVAKKQNKKN